MTSNRLHRSRAEREAQRIARWALRRDVPIAILAWFAVAGVVYWSAGHVIRSLLVLLVATLLAFALLPAVKFFERFMPRALAVILVYLVVLGVISLLFYEIINTAIAQVNALVLSIQQIVTPAGQLTPQGNQQLAPIIQFFARFNITNAQLSGLIQLVENQALGVANGALPLLSSIAEFILNVIIVAVLSIYFLLDGPRAVGWLRENAPMMQRERIHFFIDTLERVVGGYIRGQLIMSTAVGLLVGIGMFLFGLPYAVLLGVVAFVLEFIPIIGTILSGALCVLIAFTHGWLIAVFVLVYFIVVHVLEGDILAPRIIGRAVGVHPAVSLFALLAGAELFGIWGAVFGLPLAGVIQALLVTTWKEWRTGHPEQFPEDEELTDLETDDHDRKKIVHQEKVVKRAGEEK